MSDSIEAGPKRGTESIVRPRTEAIGKHRKIERSKSELELGRFVGKTEDEPLPVTPPKPIPQDEGEVVGPRRRRKAGSKTDSVKQERVDDGLKIAAPRNIDGDAKPSRKRARRRRRSKTSHAGSGRRFVIVAMLSIILVAVTAMTFYLMQRHDVVGDPLIANPAFGADLPAWRQVGSVTPGPDRPAHLTLESPGLDDRTLLARDIDLPPGDTLVDLRAQVQGDKVAPGPGDWDGARIYLVPLDTKREPVWERTEELFNLNGTTKVRNYHNTYDLPAEFSAARLGIEMKNATGKLKVTSLELTVVERRMTFLIAVSLLLGGWTALVLHIGIRTFDGISSGRIKIWLGITCVLAVIALMLPGNIHDFSTARLAARFGIEDVNVDVIGHGVMFIVLAFLVRLGRPFDPLWLHGGGWVLIAIGSEVLQLFTFGRNPSLDDLWVDGIGIIVGLTLAEGIRRMPRFSPT